MGTHGSKTGRLRGLRRGSVVAAGVLLLIVSGGRATLARTTGDQLIATAMPTATPTAGALPDLIVSSIADAQQGAPCTTPAGLKIVVTNVGAASAGSSTTLISVATGGSEYVPTSGLSPGASVTVSSSVTGIPIGDTYTATADIYGVVAEGNEANNSLSVPLALGTLPTCTPSATATFTPTPTDTPTPTPTPSSVCVGDVDGDGSVDVLDLALVAQRMGSRVGDPRYDAQFDIDHNGRIDVRDLMLVLGRLGTACP